MSRETSSFSGAAGIISQPTVLYVSLNQDHSCFAVGTTNGFYVYSVDPVKERFRKEWGMGIGIVEMLERCNILALVGGGDLPKFPKNKVVVWDDFQNRAIAELEFASELKGVKIRREIVVAILESEVHIYHFNNLNILTSLYSVSNNTGGLISLSGTGPVVMAFCSVTPGAVHVETVDPGTSKTSSLVVPAHKTDVAVLALSLDGSLLATASEKGTFIRVFNAVSGELIREFKRGTQPAIITSLNFSPDKSILVASSATGTVHVFDMTAPVPVPFVKGQNRERSIIRFHSSSPKSVAFCGADKATVIVVGYDGKYSKFSYYSEKGQYVSRSDIVDLNIFKASP